MNGILVSLIFSITSLTAWASGLSDITKTCQNFGSQKASLYAECRADNGGTYISRIRLRGVNNQDGNLTFDRDSKTMSRFHTSCIDLVVDSDAVLGGRCKKKSGAYKLTTINLSEIIFNYNGTLVYQ
jgi:hypothetical protein